MAKSVNLILGAACLLMVLDPAQASARSGGASIPLPASELGFSKLTFSSTVFTSSNVDTKESRVSGYQWYFPNFFGFPTHPNQITFNPDGALTLTSDPDVTPQLIATAAYLGSSQWVGKAFGGGGYFEVEFSFDPLHRKPSTTWPAWWGMAVEHLAYLPTQQWAGQAVGYDHFVEVDPFEYMLPMKTPGEMASWGATMHDWYGIYGKTCLPQYCDRTNYPNFAYGPIGTDFRQYNRWGFRWKVATANASGEARFYFDDVQVGPTLTWTQFTNQTPPVPAADSGSWTYGVLDQEHIVFFIGPGDTTMKLRRMEVWQVDDSRNMTH